MFFYVHVVIGGISGEASRVTNVRIITRSELVYASASRIAPWCHRKLRRGTGGTARSVALSTFYPLPSLSVPLPPPERPRKSSAIFQRRRLNQLREADESRIAPLLYHGHDEPRVSIL